MKLWRLDGGQFHVPLNALSDTLDYPNEFRTLTDSCYLVEHGDDLLLFDTGFSPTLEAHWTRLQGSPSWAASPSPSNWRSWDSGHRTSPSWC